MRSLPTLHAALDRAAERGTRRGALPRDGGAETNRDGAGVPAALRVPDARCGRRRVRLRVRGGPGDASRRVPAMRARGGPTATAGQEAAAARATGGYGASTRARGATWTRPAGSGARRAGESCNDDPESASNRLFPGVQSSSPGPSWVVVAGSRPARKRRRRGRGARDNGRRGSNGRAGAGHPTRPPHARARTADRLRIRRRRNGPRPYPASPDRGRRPVSPFRPRLRLHRPKKRTPASKARSGSSCRSLSLRTTLPSLFRRRQPHWRRPARSVSTHASATHRNKTPRTRSRQLTATPGQTSGGRQWPPGRLSLDGFGSAAMRPPYRPLAESTAVRQPRLASPSADAERRQHDGRRLLQVAALVGRRRSFASPENDQHRLRRPSSRRSSFPGGSDEGERRRCRGWLDRGPAIGCPGFPPQLQVENPGNRVFVGDEGTIRPELVRIWHHELPGTAYGFDKSASKPGSTCPAARVGRRPGAILRRQRRGATARRSSIRGLP